MTMVLQFNSSSSSKSTENLCQNAVGVVMSKNLSYVEPDLIKITETVDQQPRIKYRKYRDENNEKWQRPLLANEAIFENGIQEILFDTKYESQKA